MLQIDGSHHDRLEGRGPQLVLIAAIDDATSEVPIALFREHEDAAGYFLVLREMAQRQGIPQALYADWYTLFQSPQKPTLEHQLAGERPRSQFGRLVDELGIELLQAYSPQARGRIERLFGTLQDRVVKELRRARAITLQQTDQRLPDSLPSFDARFAMQPPQPELAYRSWPPQLDPDTVFCFKHQRTLANDNPIAFDGHRFQIPPILTAAITPAGRWKCASIWMAASALDIKGGPSFASIPQKTARPRWAGSPRASHHRVGNGSRRTGGRSRGNRCQSTLRNHPQSTRGDALGKPPARNTKIKGDKFPEQLRGHDH